MNTEPHAASNPSRQVEGIGHKDNEGGVTCASCGCECEWETCYAGCEDGYFDGYEDDPLWYDEGEMVPCNECRGQGGSWWCINKECKTNEIFKVLPLSPDKKDTNV